MLRLPSGLLAVTLAFLYTHTLANPVGLYNQGPAILDRKPQVTVAPECRSTPAISVFGDIRLFASATSFCSEYIGITRTHTDYTTVPTFEDPVEATPTPTAGRQSEEDTQKALEKELMLSNAPGAAPTRAAAEVSQACSCLLPTPITFDTTRTITKLVRATVPPEHAKARLRLEPKPEPMKERLAAFDRTGLR